MLLDFQSRVRLLHQDEKNLGSVGGSAPPRCSPCLRGQCPSQRQPGHVVSPFRALFFLD